MLTTRFRDEFHHWTQAFLSFLASSILPLSVYTNPPSYNPSEVSFHSLTVVFMANKTYSVHN